MRWKTLARAPAWAVLLLSIGLSGVEAQFTPGPASDLFRPAGAEPGIIHAGPEVIDSRPVTVDMDLLLSLRLGDSITLNLDDGVAYTGIVERADRRGSRRVSLGGSLEGSKHGFYNIVVHKDVAVGTIKHYETGRTYRIRYLAEGVHLIQTLDTGKLDPGAEPSHQDREFIHGSAGAKSDRQLSPVHDIMMVYTILARNAVGGTNAMIALCQLTIDIGNDVLMNSEIWGPRLRLVHCLEVDYDEPDNDMDEWLVWLSTNAFIDNAMDVYGADFAHLIVSGGPYCGKAWCPVDASDPFSLTRWDCTADDGAFAHEYGHNVGFEHDREHVTDPDCAYESYAYGYVFTGDDGIEYHTIMYYQSGGNLIHHWSSPNVLYDGQPTGVPIGQSGEADNATAWVGRAWDCEGFMLTRYDIWVEFAYTGVECGTYDQPFNTIQEAIDATIYGVGASERPSIWIKSGTTSATMIVNDPVVLKGYEGIVRIGYSIWPTAKRGTDR